MISKLFCGIAMAASLSLGLAYVPDASARQQDRQTMQQSAPAQMQQVRGRILDVRMVPVNRARAQNVLVLLETSQGNRVVVDVGDRLRDMNFQRGEELRARGEVVTVGPDSRDQPRRLFPARGPARRLWLRLRAAVKLDRRDWARPVCLAR
jgi:hypothetical protein